MPDDSTKWIVVLNDDETFSDLNGTWIAQPTDEVLEEMDAGSDPDDVIPPEKRVDLKKLVDWASAHGYFEEG